jgi:uncharacterized protein YjbI with pentapeptide repeats
MAGIKSRAQYQDETFVEIRLERAKISRSEFYNCTFRQCSFAETEFLKCRFSKCVFEGCDLSLIQVADSAFPGTRFVNSKVLGVNWTMADWSAYSLGEPLSFKKCSINHSTFIGLQMKGISIVDGVASDVDFRETDLSQANLSGTDFAKSLFSSTNLTEADFREAINYAINPAKNTLTRAKFSLPEAMSLLFSMDIVLSNPL